MSSTLVFHGLKELMADLQKLPEELVATGTQVVVASANQAAAEIRRGYKPSQSALADAVVVEFVSGNRGGAIARVRSKHPLAWHFENGTQVRHTRRGVSRGAIQPPLHVFIPALIRKRARMYGQLRDVLIKKGFEVIDG